MSRQPVNEVISYLHLGGVDVYNDNEFFKTHQVDLIINCTREFETPPARRCILTVQFCVSDIRSMEKTKRERDASIVLDTLPALVDLIHAHVSMGKHVLVHCQHDLQRSPTVVVAYIRRYRSDLYKPIEPEKQWTHQSYLDKSIQVVRQGRPIFGSYISFGRVLQDYDKKLYAAGQ